MEPKALSSIAKFAFKFCNELGNSKTTVCSPMCAESVLALLALGCQNETHAELLRALDFPDGETELKKGKTTICSPLSVETVLALLALGCQNETREELFKALDFPNDEALRSSFTFITSSLESVEGVTLNIANKVYLKKGGTLKPDIQKDAEEVFKSSVEQLDFLEKVASADMINEWVAKKTNNLIKDIVSPEMFNGDTRFVLLNAIYFLGKWRKPFYTNYTWARDFHVNKNTKIKVPQMYMSKTYFKYRARPELKAQLLQMDYKGAEASMVIVLPDEIEGLSEVMQKLAAGYNLMSDIETLRSEYLNILIPKFKAEMTIDLKTVLPKLGIQSIFNKNTAEIDMLTSNEELCVSDAIQKAFITVDESGTEAAAVTAMRGYVLRCAQPEPKKFYADRPFLYLLIVNKIPLFIGVYGGTEYASTLAAPVCSTTVSTLTTKEGLDESPQAGHVQ